jgi:hypothetical protein
MSAAAPAISARQFAVDALRGIPHEHIRTQLTQYSNTHPQAAQLLNQILVEITAEGRYVYDIIRDRLVNKPSRQEVQILTEFAASLYKSYPTNVSLVTESSSDGEMWHRLDKHGAEERVLFCVTKRRARKLQKDGAIKPGFYVVAASPEMMEAMRQQSLRFINLFYGYYGMERRPVMIGDLSFVPQLAGTVTVGPMGEGAASGDSVSGEGESDTLSPDGLPVANDLDSRFVTTLLPTATTKAERLRLKDAKEKKPANAEFFQLVLPNGVPYAGSETNPALTRLFVSKLLALYEIEASVEQDGQLQFEDAVMGVSRIRMTHLQASHNVGLPFPVIPKPTWKLVAVLNPNGEVIQPAPIQTAADSSATKPGSPRRIGQIGSSSSKKKRVTIANTRKAAMASSSMFQTASS